MHESGKSKGGSGFGKMTMILIGIGMIVFASTCFKEVPLIGTIFLMPGDNILQARMSDPALRYFLFMVGVLLTACGIQLQIRIGFTNPLKRSNAVHGKPVSRRKPWGLT